MDMGQSKECFVAVEAIDREWHFCSMYYMSLNPYRMEDDNWKAMCQELREWEEATKDGLRINQYLGNGEHVIVPNTANGKRIYLIGEDAFGIEKIDYNTCPTYTDNTTIEEIVISEGIEALEGINYCPNLRSITLPQTLKYIGDGISNTAIEQINLPNKIKHIHPYCFMQNKKLNRVTLSDNIIDIGDGAFLECVQLSSIVFPQSLKQIGKEAFIRTGLKYVTIPEGITRIEDRVFADCRELRGCVIPRSVNHIGEDAFSWCAEEIKGREKYPYFQRFDYFNNPNLVLYVYPGSYGLMWAREHGYPVQNADI